MDSCPYCATPTTSNDQSCPNCGANLNGFQLERGAVFGKYLIGNVLGQGGFGITYLAEDTLLQRQVAIKELFPDGSTRKNSSLIPPNSLGVTGFLEAKTRFLEEARTLAQFNHPGIVRVLEVFEANNTAYLVMEALTGETLGAKIAREKKLPEAEVKTLALELCDALEVVHKVGLLHRDIKPDNIFLTQDARVVLIDFGSARSFHAGERTQHTQLVSPGYAAPEQYASEAKFGEYTDVYGVAATLYHALLGNPPPSATDRLIGSAKLEFPKWVNTPIQTALTEGLSIAIQSRPASASEFARLFTHSTAIKKEPLSNTKDQIKTHYQSWDVAIKDHYFLTSKKSYDLLSYAYADMKVRKINTFSLSQGNNPIISGCLLPALIPFFLLLIFSAWSQIGASIQIISISIFIVLFYFYYYFPSLLKSNLTKVKYEISLYREIKKENPESIYISDDEKKIRTIVLLIKQIIQHK
jgi:serine/threonine protein kinase